MVITGGGMLAITENTKNGGASSWFAGATVPYATEISRDYVWDGPLVSAEAAQMLAYQAQHQNRSLSSIDNLIVASCTAKLTYHGEREGREHYAFVYICDEYQEEGEACYKITFGPGLIRLQQEQFLAQTYCSIIQHHARGMRDFNNPNVEKIDIEPTEGGLGF